MSMIYITDAISVLLMLSYFFSVEYLFYIVDPFNVSLYNFYVAYKRKYTFISTDNRIDVP